VSNIHRGTLLEPLKAKSSRFTSLGRTKPKSNIASRLSRSRTSIVSIRTCFGSCLVGRLSWRSSRWYDGFESSTYTSQWRSGVASWLNWREVRQRLRRPLTTSSCTITSHQTSSCILMNHGVLDRVHWLFRNIVDTSWSWLLGPGFEMSLLIFGRRVEIRASSFVSIS
jgi:hypothetical protein